MKIVHISLLILFSNEKYHQLFQTGMWLFIHSHFSVKKSLADTQSSLEQERKDDASHLKLRILLLTLWLKWRMNKKGTRPYHFGWMLKFACNKTHTQIDDNENTFRTHRVTIQRVIISLALRCFYCRQCNGRSRHVTRHPHHFSFEMMCEYYKF